MAKFCGKCGSKLDEVTGLCLNCDATKMEDSSAKKELAEKTEKKTRSGSKNGKTVKQKRGKEKEKGRQEGS